MHFLCTWTVERHKRTLWLRTEAQLAKSGPSSRVIRNSFFWITIKRQLNKSAVFKTRYIRVNSDNYNEKNSYCGDDYKRKKKQQQRRRRQLGLLRYFVSVATFLGQFIVLLVLETSSWCSWAVTFISLLDHSTCFGRFFAPIIRGITTVYAAPGTSYTTENHLPAWQVITCHVGRWLSVV